MSGGVAIRTEYLPIYFDAEGNVMPPANSPRLPRDFTYEGPFMTTRLPIVRPDEEAHIETSSWRELLARAVDQSSETSQDYEIDNLPSRAANLRLAGARRIERTQPTTYRGWAPGTIESDHAASSSSRRLPSRYDLHHSQPSRTTATRRYLREMERNQPAREGVLNSVVEPLTADGQSGLRLRNRESTTLTRSPSSSLRASALLEAARRQQRLESLRDRIRSFTDARAQENEQSLDQLDILDEYSRLTNDYGTASQERGPANHHLQAVMNEHHTTKLLQETIKHMDERRDHFTEDAPSVPIAPPQSSYLRAGASFLGQQQANNAKNSRRYQNSQLSDPDPYLRYGAVQHEKLPEQSGDWWPVKVKITSVDYTKMTLTGTMEAFGVSKTKDQKGHESVGSDITTYLEGEILDFHKHTLKTTNFKAGSMIDSAYWRKLEPFKSLDNTEIVDGLRDPDWLREHMAQNWIIMRWKEKCFITSSESSSALTISGFYYICMRRSDGKIEGYYHDPSACPYQRLNLMPDRPTFPVYTIT